MGSGRTLLIVIALTACSSPPGGGGNGASSTPESACADWAAEFCDRLSVCSPPALQIRYGDVAQCAERRKPICLAALQAAGTGATPASMEKCSGLFGTASCDDIYVERSPQGCTVAGSLGPGAPCGDDSQCSGPNGYCKIDYFQTCGTCATLGTVGASCSRDADCVSGLCGTVTTPVCTMPAAEGSPCGNGTVICRGSCTNGTCTKRLGLGAPCDPMADLCDSNYGYCDAQAKVCSPFKTLALGASCAATMAATYCASGTCGAQGTCVPNASNGAACSDSIGPYCTNPAVCVNEVCVFPNATACH
jgi:hypothetical protein